MSFPPASATVAVPEPAAEPPLAAEQTQLSLKVRTLDQRTYSITIGAAASVPQLKELIAVQTGVTLARQRLIYRGRVLKNDQTLAAYSLEDGHVLHLVARTEPLPNDVDQGTLIVGPVAYPVADGSESDALDARMDEFERSSRRFRSRSRPFVPPPMPSFRDNDEPDSTMGRPGRNGENGRVLMGATISVPEGADVTMPFLNSMIANLVTQVSENGAGADNGDINTTARDRRRTPLLRDSVGNRSTAADMEAAAARALRRHHRNRDGPGRFRNDRRSISSVERQAALRARIRLQLESIRAALDDTSLDFPAELTALTQSDSNAAMVELQQHIELLLTLVERFRPRLRVVAAALTQRDRTGGGPGAVPLAGSSSSSLPESATIESRASDAAPVESVANSSHSTDYVSATATTEPTIHSGPVIRAIELLTTIGESIDGLACMARYAFTRQSVQLSELGAREHSTVASDRTSVTFDQGAIVSSNASEGQAPAHALSGSARAVRLSARSAATSRSRVQFHINATDFISNRNFAATRSVDAAPAMLTGTSLNVLVDPTRSVGAANAVTSSQTDTQSRQPDSITNDTNASAPPASSHISISGMGFPLVSSVVFPFSLAAGLGGSHATTTWNLADFVRRLTSELPISTLYGVVAGDATQLYRLLAHIGFALLSGVDVPRATRPNFRSWAQEFENELRALLCSRVLPRGVLDQVFGPEERRVDFGNEFMRIIEPSIPELIDLFFRATSASRAAAFGTSSAMFLRSIAQQIIDQIRAYARGDSMEDERDSNERLVRLLQELFVWFGMYEPIACFVIDNLLSWTAIDDRRGRIRAREESKSDSTAVKRRRE